MENLTNNIPLSRTVNAKCIDLGEEGILYSQSKDKKHIANTTAMAVWDLIDGKRTAQEIAREIANVCGVEPYEIEDEILHQIILLKELGIIEVVSGLSNATV